MCLFMSAFILLAEDDPDIQLIARLALKKAGFRVEVVDNGRLLLERLADVRPDLVLLDWMMPEMDGPETFRRLQASESLRGIPVAFMTARAERPGDVPQAAGYISKPLDLATLGDQVRAILQRSAT